MSLVPVTVLPWDARVVRTGREYHSADCSRLDDTDSARHDAVTRHEAESVGEVKPCEKCLGRIRPVPRVERPQYLKSLITSSSEW